MSACSYRWTWRSGEWWMRARGACGRSPEAFITLRHQHRAARASTRCFRYFSHTCAASCTFFFLWTVSQWVPCSPQAFFSSITDMCENGGKRPVSEVSVGFTKEQADTIRRIRNSKDSWDMLGVKPGATRWVASIQAIFLIKLFCFFVTLCLMQFTIFSFLGRRWTRRTGSWQSCCIQINVLPPAVKTRSRRWWTPAPHC